MQLSLCIFVFFTSANSRRFGIKSNGKSAPTGEYVNFGNSIPSATLARSILPKKFVMADPNVICRGIQDSAGCRRKLHFLKLKVTLGQLDDTYAQELMDRMIKVQKNTEKLIKLEKSNDKIRQIVPEYQDEFRKVIPEEKLETTPSPKVFKSKNLEVPQTRKIRTRNTMVQKPVQRVTTTNNTRRTIFYCFVLGECSFGGMKRTPFINKLQAKLEGSVTKMFPTQIQFPKLQIPNLQLPSL